MKIVNLRCQNFRNYNFLDIKFNDSLNIFIGENAAGKTNILEAIYFLAITKSIINTNIYKIIKKDCDFCIVKGNVLTETKSYNLEIKLSKKGSLVFVNEKKVNSLSNYISYLKIILFSPLDIKYFRDYPLTRRRIINIDISKISNNYLYLLNNYNHLLKQRNVYLKSIFNNNYDSNYLMILNNQLINYGYKIFLCRNDFINRINIYLESIYEEISGFKNLKLIYLSQIKSKENYENEIFNSIKKDFDYKNTSFGIHRDDFVFNLNDVNLTNYGSQGQLRMAILCYKISLVKLYDELGLEKPILLLDDVFSELDIKKRNKITKFLNMNSQVIITTTDLNMVDSSLLDKASVFCVENGNVNKIVRDGEKNE